MFTDRQTPYFQKCVFRTHGRLKQAIRMSSKMEFLEHGKEKAIVKVENLRNLEQIIRNYGIQTNSKSETSCVDSNLRPRCEASGTSKDLTRLSLATRLENQKSAEWGIEELR
ncbi:hypothetical protein AVEN_230457-1 [Araneus ventricosus]|uniref:Uncharacterized protein n=1 Tax=Araneus ventricosus TaxID=182803 RepID=A0A4Y2KS04_ARAVE|nr:hypothetical protein AVEN_230457-1 [Araneus ventricosus]